MLHVAICENAGAGAMQSIIRSISKKSDVTTHDFDNIDGLTKSMSGGNPFDLFLLDRAALDQFLATHKKEVDPFFTLNSQKGIVKIPLSTIIYIGSSHRRLVVYREDTEPLYSISLRVCFAEAIAPLMRDKRFLYARKFCLINMDKVESVSKGTFALKDGSKIAIPRYAMVEARNAYLSYLSDSS